MVVILALYFILIPYALLPFPAPITSHPTSFSLPFSLSLSPSSFLFHLANLAHLLNYSHEVNITKGLVLCFFELGVALSFI